MFQFGEGQEKNIEFGKEVKTYYFSNDFDANYPGTVITLLITGTMRRW